MKLEFDSQGASVFVQKLGSIYFHKKADEKCLRQGKPWIVEYDIIMFRSIFLFEIYTLKEKDKSETHWLVEHRMLYGTGKVVSGPCKIECIPHFPVEFVKEDLMQPNYWLVKRINEKEL